MSGNFLLLSLFIVMLSFFLMLNSFSTREPAKAQTALHSLQQTFPQTPANISIVPSPNDMNRDIAENPLDRLDALVAPDGSQAERKNRVTDRMVIHLTRREFQDIAEGKPVGGKPAGYFLDVMADILSADSASRYRMDVMLNSAGPLGGAAAGSLADIAARVEKAGLPIERITFGLQNGPPGRLDFIFRRAREGGKG